MRAILLGLLFGLSLSACKGDGAVRVSEGLIDVVDGRDAHELHVGVEEQAADHLRRAVTGAPEDRCLEPLHAERLSPARGRFKARGKVGS